MNQFFDRLGSLLSSAAQRLNADIEPPQVDARVALELLELARVAAHTSERRFAPLSCYMAGVAAERLRTSAPGIDEAAIAAFIQDAREELAAR
jgi:Domain of unknown function (DUF6457)